MENLVNRYKVEISPWLISVCTEVLKTYAEVTKRVKMSGPTSFSPIVNEAVRVVKKANAVCL